METRHWLIVGGALLGMLLVLGAILFHRSRSDGEGSSPGAGRSEYDVGGSKPGTPVTAAGLFATYQANEVSADRSYKDEVLDVSGFVIRVGKGPLGGRYVILGSGEEFEILGVQCEFDQGADDGLAALSPGQGVKIRGTCRGMFGNVLLARCRLLP